MKKTLSATSRLALIICFSTWLSHPGTASSQEMKGPLAGHVFIGQMTMENASQDVGGGDYEIMIFGVDAQRPVNVGPARYGLEVGGLFSLDSDGRRFSASSGSEGGKVSVSVDINSLMLDFFFGGYVAVLPADWLRLYAGAGPLLIYARRETEPEESVASEYETVTESGLGAGVYARAGIDITITHNVGLNAGARFTQTTLSFDDTAGEIDVQGWQYYGGMAFHF